MNASRPSEHPTVREKKKCQHVSVGSLGSLSLSNLNYTNGCGSVPSYRVTQLRTDGIHGRESAGTGPVGSSKRVLPRQVTMDHLICVCVCFLPIHSGHQVRWTYQPGSHRRKVTQDF